MYNRCQIIRLVQIYLTPEYKRNLYELSKKQGNFTDDRLSGLGKNYEILKETVKNSNIQKKI